MGLLGKRKREADRGRGSEGGPSLLFNGRVNKSLVKLSGLQPRVFTALVSITNKSRMAPHHHRRHSSATPAAPFFFPLSCLALLGTAN